LVIDLIIENGRSAFYTTLPLSIYGIMLLKRN
jgi:hypothetical protein